MELSAGDGLTAEQIEQALREEYKPEVLRRRMNEQAENYVEADQLARSDCEDAAEYYADHAMGGAIEYDLVDAMKQTLNKALPEGQTLNDLPCADEVQGLLEQIVAEQDWADPSFGQSLDSMGTDLSDVEDMVG